MWAEDLPADCPPDDFSRPQGESFYRLVKSIPPTASDFFSQHKQFPGRKFKAPECQAKSLSIFKKLDDCLNIRKLPTLKQMKVIRIKLTPESGVIKHTPSQNSTVHYSWWMASNYDPNPFCDLFD